nr:DNA repair protein RecN [Anaerotignum lactatifermentans]
MENLHIKNAALIAECDLHFAPGLNILTGETGAGKSMILGSLQFALGGRADRDLLRRGEKQAVVEALFSTEEKAIHNILEENGIETEADGQILISRTLNESGKSICRINGCTVTAGMLRQIAAELMDLYGQHEHQSLLNPSRHIRLLDRFCGEKLAEKLAVYSQWHEKRKDASQRLEALLGDESQRAQRLDILRFQTEEIAAAGLREGEEESLLERKKRLAGMEKLMRLTSEGVALLYDGAEGMASVCDLLSQALEDATEAAELDPEIKETAEVLETAYAQIEDCARTWKRYGAALEAEPEALEETEERLQTIYRLKRKYGGSVAAVLEFYEKAIGEMEFLENSEEAAAKLEKQRKEAEEQLMSIAGQITALRRERAAQVERQVEEALHQMQMSQAKFRIAFAQRDDFGKDGRDKVEFLISANQGEDLKPLAKIASGGEMSRVMLALKSVLVDGDEIGTFVFDEIDAGISGKTARKVGEKMHLLGKKRQILCITHLPQIAALADRHFRITKEEGPERTETKVALLDEDGACREVARLIGGEEITETTLAAARELREAKN